MKQNLLLIFSFFLISQLAAQNLSFDVSPVVVNGVEASDFEGVGHSIVTNTASTERSFRWNRNIVQITDGWDIAVCDKVQCYHTTVETQDFLLAPNEGGTMDVHAYPREIEGSAVVEITITDINDESQNLSNLYYFNTPTSTNEAIASQSLKVYPNPSNGLFSLKGEAPVASLEVFNLTGQKVASFKHNDGQWYNISDLPRGTYLVRLLGDDAKELTTKLINKM